MKKVYLYSLAALMLASCASDDFVQSDEKLPNGTADATGFLTINLVSPRSIGNRADGDYTQDGGEYVDGTSAENNVSKVRFYFFKEAEACEVRVNPQNPETYFSYIDWTPSSADNVEGGPQHNETVEKTLTTTLVFSKPADGENPDAVVAVINPPASLLTYNATNGNPDLVTLRSLVNNYLQDEDGNFVMSNSVFATDDATGSDGSLETGPYAQYAQPILESQISTEAPATLGNPVNIYVERVAARVDFQIALTNSSMVSANGNYDTQVTFAPQNVPGVAQSQEQAVYFKPLGWALASFTNESYLIKEINPGWSDLFNNAGDPWNIAALHRSFWAMNPQNVTYNYYSYNQITGAPAVGTTPAVDQLGNAMTSKSIYTQENANPYQLATAEGYNLGKEPSSPTKVIFVGQLVDSSNTPLTVCEFRGMQFTEEGLMTYVASLLNMYTKVGDNYVHITADDLTLQSESAWAHAGVPQMDDPGRYYSYFILSNPTGKTWYSLAAPNDYREITGDISAYIDNDLGNSHAKVWKNGMTYYYFDIKHLGTPDESVAELGVVRNHIYDTTVTSLKGLGTPVLDPNEVIYPEQPTSDENMVVTTINILSWRLVSSTYDVEWP